MTVLLSFEVVEELLKITRTLFDPSGTDPPLVRPSPVATAAYQLFSPYFLTTATVPGTTRVRFSTYPRMGISCSLSSKRKGKHVPFDLQLMRGTSQHPIGVLYPWT